MEPDAIDSVSDLNRIDRSGNVKVDDSISVDVFTSRKRKRSAVLAGTSIDGIALMA